MNFAELKQELADRGFNFLSDTRRGRYINQAYIELCRLERWPFLEATAQGEPPLAITDLGAIQSVFDSDRNAPLRPEDRRTLIDASRDLTDAGEPVYYYIEGGNTVTTYPLGGTLVVRYWKVPAELSGTQEPVVPVDFHNLIVDGAVRRAYFDSDEPAAAEAVEAERQRGLALMAQTLLWQDSFHTPTILDFSGSEDW